VQDKRNVKEAVLSLFELAAGGDYIMQAYDTDFDDWVDIDDPSSLPDCGKLKIIVCSGDYLAVTLLGGICKIKHDLQMFLFHYLANGFRAEIDWEWD